MHHPPRSARRVRSDSLGQSRLLLVHHSRCRECGLFQWVWSCIVSTVEWPRNPPARKIALAHRRWIFPLPLIPQCTRAVNMVCDSREDKWTSRSRYTCRLSCILLNGKGIYTCNEHSGRSARVCTIVQLYKCENINHLVEMHDRMSMCAPTELAPRWAI